MTKSNETEELFTLGWKGKSIHPMQPVIKTETGQARFQRNEAVRMLRDESQKRGYGLNELWPDMDKVPNSEDHKQHFAQLIGYSVDGYSTLSYHNHGIARRAARLSEKLLDATLAKQAAAENERIMNKLRNSDE